VYPADAREIDTRGKLFLVVLTPPMFTSGWFHSYLLGSVQRARVLFAEKVYFRNGEIGVARVVRKFDEVVI